MAAGDISVRFCNALGIFAVVSETANANEKMQKSAEQILQLKSSQEKQL